MEKIDFVEILLVLDCSTDKMLIEENKQFLFKFSKQLIGKHYFNKGGNKNEQVRVYCKSLFL